LPAKSPLVWAAPLPHLRDNGFVIALMGMASPLNLRPMIDKALATEGPPPSKDALEQHLPSRTTLAFPTVHHH
jgi:hypothetical protein